MYLHTTVLRLSLASLSHESGAVHNFASFLDTGSGRMPATRQNWNGTQTEQKLSPVELQLHVLNPTYFYFVESLPRSAPNIQITIRCLTKACNFSALRILASAGSRLQHCNSIANPLLQCSTAASWCKTYYKAKPLVFLILLEEISSVSLLRAL